MELYKDVDAPWGNWRVVHADEHEVVKIITVYPGDMLSLQMHADRDEVWIPLNRGLIAHKYYPVNGFPTLVVADTSVTLTLGTYQQFNVPRGWVHRLINPTTKPITLVEIIYGKYDESDIVRLQDSYGRA